METNPLIEIKLQNEQLYALKILSNNTDDLQREISTLDKKTKQQLQKTPLILEVENNALQANELAVLMEVFAQNNMSVAGVRTHKQTLIDFAQLLGLSIFNNPSVALKPKPNPKPNTTDSVAKNSRKNGVHQAPKIQVNALASGEQALSEAADLVLLKRVNRDAEAVSGGSIFAYQAVCGKVFAGVYGDKNATIFIQSFNAQIVSIAGVYKKFETPPEKLHLRCVIIDLHQDKLRFQIL